MWFKKKRKNGQRKETKYSGESSESSNRGTIELIYKLDPNLRDAIICNLNRFTQLLFGEQLSAADKQRLLQAFGELSWRLMNLPLKSDEETDERPSDVLELAFGVKAELLSALVANYFLSEIISKTSEEAKLKRIVRNNSLISRLSKLPVSVSNGVSQGTANGRMPNDAPNSPADELSEINELAEKIAALELAKSRVKSERPKELYELFGLSFACNSGLKESIVDLGCNIVDIEIESID